MNQLFKRSSSNWIRYDRYEWRTDKKGIFYITPAKDAKPDLYNPIKEADELVLAAINLGLLCMKSETGKEELKNSIMTFVTKYGLLGFMTALPTTPEFITHEAVYLPLNHFIKEESMTTERYLSYFFPFEQISFSKKNRESVWNITDKDMMAITMALKNKPQAVNMSFQKEYAERYDWLVEEFKDWAFTFVTSFLYYQDYDILNNEQKRLYQQGMSAFGGIAPTYHVELRERPTLVWDFHSLLLEIQMMFSFMLTDEKSSIKVCKHCGKAFIASRPNAEFCSPQCKNQYNVYKSRSKKMDAMDEDDD